MDAAVAKTKIPRRQMLTLIMTEHCNLQCTYCYERKKKDKTVLSLELAQKAITEAFENPDFDELEINFFGGEPLVAFKTITKICEWVWTHDWPKPFLMFATTNGTLVHGKIKEWFTKHREGFVLSLSLDGTPEMHNINRSNSFKDIDVDFFRKTWPYQTCKTTFSRQTIGRLAEGLIYIHKLGFRPNACPAGGIEWEKEDYDSYAREMKKLADFYLENPEIMPCTLITMPIDRVAQFAEYMTKSGDKKVPNCCGAGKNISCIDRCGRKYPCQTFLPMSVGKNYDHTAAAKLLASEDNFADPKCVNCCLISECQTCYGVNYLRTGSPFLRNEHNCVFSKIAANASAYLLSDMIANRGKNYAFLKEKSDTDLFYMIKGINLIKDTIVL